MSGGIAFVYKLRADRVNHEALAASELRLEKVTGAKAEELKELLELHVSETGSLLAEQLLAKFDEVVGDFTLVLPRDYASVLEIRAKAVATGTDPDSDEVWQSILEVTNG